MKICITVILNYVFTITSYFKLNKLARTLMGTVKRSKSHKAIEYKADCFKWLETKIILAVANSNFEFPISDNDKLVFWTHPIKCFMNDESYS